MIKSIVKWTFVALTASVILASMALYFAHHRVVTRGEFLGLKIGETKEEVFLKLVDKQNVTSVSPEVTEDLVVNRNNIDDLSKLAGHQAFIVRGPKTSVRVYVTSGYISEISSATAGWQMESVAVGVRVDAVFPIIKNYILNEPNGRVFATIKNSREVLVVEGVAAIGNPEFAWLRQFDRWAFFENDRHTAINLYFADGHLTKIDYKNYFAG